MEQNTPAVFGSVERMVRPLALALACLAAAGCTPAGVANEAIERPEGWKVFTTPGGSYHYVFPVVMEDGTRCIAMAGNSTGGRAISCDWRR